MIEFLDPRAEPGSPVETYALGLGEAIDGGAVTIGLLANGFADSEAFLAEVARALGARLDRARFAQYCKPNPSLLAGEELIERIVSECDAVVAAYGH